jgi:hypothetical protein
MNLSEAFKITNHLNYDKISANKYSESRNDLDDIIKDYSCSRQIKFDWKKIPYTRIDFINLALKNFTDPAYLEIGTHKNKCFDQINANDKTGVDPIGFGEKVLKKTSDEFFLSYNNDKTYDVIFIDGLHTHDQVRKDAINSLKYLKKNGIIFFHDMLPLSWMAECPERIQVTWNGDVWKAGYELNEANGLDFNVILADHGIGMLKKLENNYILNTQYDQINKLRYNDFLESKIDYIEAETAVNFIKNIKI